ncbi:MAG: FadR/GntR family transcriptional regulator, partial [Nitrospinota bacterium]|nr:FadR/GntR family transcriptional regulator [Nitrospinota bacterium]
MIETRLQAVKKVRVYEEIVSQITNLILEGELQQGDKLPSERGLCEQFSVGRNSVREAVRALESGNLVETRQGEGSFIKAGPATLVSLHSDLLSSKGEEGVRSLFEARRILEPQVVSLASVRVTASELKKLQQVVLNQKIEISKGGTGIFQDTDFHLRLASAAKNEFLYRLVKTLLDSLSEVRERSIREHSVRIRSCEGHQQILDSLRKRDSKTCSSEMLSHLLDIEGIELD